MQQVTKHYDEHLALDGVSLKVEPGEFFTLLGPSGCGKTTLLRCIAGLERPDSGEIVINNKQVTAESAHVRKVNTVFQSYALFPHLNVTDNIAFGLRMRGISKAERHAKVAKILEFMHLEPLASRRPDQLSGGQQQRVALSRALVNEPQILLLDEPLSALDAKLRTELQLELKRTQQRLGMTFVLVTHDQAEALTLSDRIAVMRNGRVEQVGGVTELYERPRTAYVAEFLGLANCLPVNRVDGNALDTPIGRLMIEPAATNVSKVMIRPERLRIGCESLPGYNSFQTVVRERIYLGASSRYSLEIGDYCLTAVVAHQGHGCDLPEMGETITVQAHPQDVIPLADD
ncbi:MAG: ABC transporter ATP-binding protein [Gammaproteobacteria bacterium]